MGLSGNGKTTVSRRLAGQLGLPHVELDAIYHQPGWRQLPRDEFRARVDERLAAFPNLEVVRLRSPDEVGRWLDEQGTSGDVEKPSGGTRG